MTLQPYQVAPSRPVPPDTWPADPNSSPQGRPATGQTTDALTGRDRQVRAAGSAKCPANNTRTSTADSQPGRPSAVEPKRSLFREALLKADQRADRFLELHRGELDSEDA